MSNALSYIKRHWYLPLTLILAALSLLTHLPTGDEIVSLGWDTFFTLILLSIASAGIEKEKVLSPMAAFISMLRYTYFTLLFSLIASYVLGAMIGGYASALLMVPITLSILKNAERGEYAAKSAAAVTIASVLGSMALPSGSIANLYLRDRADSSFVMAMLPLSITGFLLLFILPLFILGKNIKDEIFIHKEIDKSGSSSMRTLYICLMIIATLTALGSFFYFDILILFIVVIAIFDRKVLLRVNWAIPLSFIFLSIFINAADWSISSPLALGFASEIFGSTVSALLAEIPIAADALRAVNIGGLGLITGMAAYGVAARIGKEGKTYVICYLLYSLPIIAILSLAAVLL